MTNRTAISASRRPLVRRLKLRGKRHPRSRQLSLESLDARQMMAADVAVALEDGVLHITGTDQADVVEIRTAGDSDKVRILVAGQERHTFERRDVAKVRFLGGAGNDVFVNRSDIPAEAFGGDGDDWLVGGSARDLLDGGAGEDTLIGNSNDHLIGEGREKVTDADSLVKRLTDKLWSLSSDQVKQQLEQLQLNTADARQKIVDAISKAIQGERDKLKSAIDGLREPVQRTMDDAQKRLDKAAEDLSDLLAQFDTWQSEAENRLRDALTDAANKAKQKSDEVRASLEDARDKATKAADAARVAAENRLNNELAAAERRASDQLAAAARAKSRRIDDADNAAHAVIDSAYRRYQSLRRDWKDWQARQEQSLRAALDRAISLLPRWARHRASGLVDQFHSEVKKVQDRADRLIANAYDTYRDARANARAVRDRAVNTAIDAHRSATATIGHIRTGAISQARDIYNAAKDAADKLRADLVQTAERVAKSAVDGLQAAHKTASEKAKADFETAKSNIDEQRESARARFTQTQSDILAERDGLIAEIESTVTPQIDSLVAAHGTALDALNHLQQALLTRLSGEYRTAESQLQNVDKYFQSLGSDDDSDLASRWQAAFEKLEPEFGVLRQAADQTPSGVFEAAKVVGAAGVAVSVPTPWGQIAIDASTSQHENGREASVTASFWIVVGATRSVENVNQVQDGSETIVSQETRGLVLGVDVFGYGVRFTGYEDQWDGETSGFDDGLMTEIVTPYFRLYKDRNGVIGLDGEVTQLKTLKALVGLDLSLDVGVKDIDGDGKLDVDHAVATMQMDWLPKEWTFSVGLERDHNDDLQVVFGTSYDADLKKK